MRRFQQLLQGLDRTTGTSAKQHLLENYFRAAPAADAAWGLELLLGKRRRRLITGRRLRQVAQQLSGLPPWLLTTAMPKWATAPKRWPSPFQLAISKPLINRCINGWSAACLSWRTRHRAARQGAGSALGWLCQDDIYLLSKLLSGGFRVGVSGGLVQKRWRRPAWAQHHRPALDGWHRAKRSAFEQLMNSEARPVVRRLGAPIRFFWPALGGRTPRHGKPIGGKRSGSGMAFGPN